MRLINEYFETIMSAVLIVFGTKYSGPKKTTPVTPGDSVRIVRTIYAPMRGQVGVVSIVDPNDRYGAYLVTFPNGLQYRYGRGEIVLIGSDSAIA